MSNLTDLYFDNPTAETDLAWARLQQEMEEARHPRREEIRSYLFATLLTLTSGTLLAATIWAVWQTIQAVT